MAEIKDGPVEVWLRQTNMAVSCMVVHEDERTEELRVDSLSMRGAQREMSGWFLSQGYKPAGRWEYAYQDDSPVDDDTAVHTFGECFRRFQPA